MSVADDIAYLRGLTSHTMTSASPFRFHQIADKLDAYRKALNDAVTPHAFNCGYEKHPTAIKIVPVGHCNCGVSALLEEGKE